MAQSDPFSLSLTPARVGRVLGWSVATLVALHLLGRVAISQGRDSVFGLVPLFSLGNEYNVPALFSTMLLLAAAGIILLIALDVRRDSAPFQRHWLLLGITFVLLGVDEMLGFHELLNTAVLGFVTPTGLLHFPWVVVALPLVALFGLLYIPFLLHLPRRTALGFLAAGTVYVGAALGLEMIGGAIVDESGRGTFTYQAAQTLEEGFEMAGATLFIYFLLDHFGTRHGEIQIRTAAATRAAAGRLRDRRLGERRSPPERLRRAQGLEGFGADQVTYARTHRSS